MTRLISIDETKDRLTLSRSKVEDLIRTNELTAVKIGSARRVVEQSVEDYITRLVEATETAP